MVALRELKKEDAPLMYEWMQDEEISGCFSKDMLSLTLEDAYDFCVNSVIPIQVNHGDSLHFAIVEQEKDEYLGTVSLKDIDLKHKHAEFAICLRKRAHGKGIAKKAVIQILKKAFEEYNLHKVFLNVLSDNIAAIHLYEKCGFVLEGEFREYYFKYNQYINLKWYGILKEEYVKRYVI